MSEKLTISVSQTEVDPDGANKFVGWKGSQFFSAKAGLVGKKSSPKVGKAEALHHIISSSASSMVISLRAGSL